MLRPLSALLFTALLGLTGCQSAYYAAMEKVGVHKRDILVDRVEEARDSQQEAKEQFQSALDRYRSVVQVKGGELEARYEALNKEYLASESSAKEVRARIEAVEDVAEALFEEWEASSSCIAMPACATPAPPNSSAPVRSTRPCWGACAPPNAVSSRY